MALDAYYFSRIAQLRTTLEGKGGDEMYIGVGTVILILAILLLLALLF